MDGTVAAGEGWSTFAAVGGAAGMRGAHLGRELPLGILRSPQMLHELFIFHRALRHGKDRTFSKTLRLSHFPLVNLIHDDLLTFYEDTLISYSSSVFRMILKVMSFLDLRSFSTALHPSPHFQSSRKHFTLH